jgi:hypothetical protein
MRKVVVAVAMLAVLAMGTVAMAEVRTAGPGPLYAKGGPFSMEWGTILPWENGSIWPF